MSINQNLIELLKNNSINVSDSVSYLLSLYFGYEPSYIPELLKKKINTLNIVSYNSTSFTYTWQTPLFANPEEGLEWVVTEYLPIFKPFSKDNKFKRECVTRMSVLLLEFPDLTKDLILAGTKLYIGQCLQERRQAKFVSNPHYFIQKDKGVNKTNPILTYTDLVRENRTSNKGRSSESITMR